MIKTLVTCCFLLTTTLFAGEIRSTDESVNYYLKVEEVADAQYTFAVCDKTDNCSLLSRGLSHTEESVRDLVKKLRSKGKRQRVGSIALSAVVGIGSVWGGTVGGAYIGAALDDIFGVLPGLIVGFLGGLGVGATLDYLILAKWMNPKQCRQLSAAIDEALDGNTTIERDDMMNLAEVLDDLLIKMIK